MSKLSEGSKLKTFAHLGRSAIPLTLMEAMDKAIRKTRIGVNLNVKVKTE